MMHTFDSRICKPTSFFPRSARVRASVLASLAVFFLFAVAAPPPATADSVPTRAAFGPSLPDLYTGAGPELGPGVEQALALPSFGGDVVTGLDGLASLQQEIVDVAALDDYFEPAVVTITVGSAVRWTNRGSQVHSTTSDDGHWNWALQPGFSYGVRFLSAGTFDYHCSYHRDGGSGGRVVVLPDQQITPPIPGPSPTPQPTPQPGELPSAGAIVFDYFADEAQRGQSELFLVEPDGSAPRRLTTTALVAEAQPSWSPDRRFVAHARREGTGPIAPWRIGTLDLTTGQSRTITAGPADFEPDWHPNGAWIAYTHVEQGPSGQRSEIRMTRVDPILTQVLVRLDSSSQVVADPSWAPDGQSLVFTVGGPGGGSLYRWRPGAVERITGRVGWDDIDPSISPDGRYVAYASGTNLGAGVRHDIWLVDLSTGQRGVVATHPEWDLRRPAWSPEGDRLVFNARFARTPDRWALYTVPATGGTVSGPLASGVEPDWAASRQLSPPTPEPGPTTAPPPPPPFPTPGEPAPTPQASPTAGPPPTFPPPVEPTPTMIVTATAEATPEATSTIAPPEASPTLPATPGVSAGRIYLPLGLNGAAIRETMGQALR